MKKIIGISCSPRKGKTAYRALEECMSAVTEYNSEIKTEIIELAGMKITPCNACGHCKKELNCSIDDDFRGLISLLSDPDIRGMVVSSPVYMGGITATGKAFLDRTVMFRRNGFMFKNMIGGAVSVGGSRNGGQELTIQNIHASMLIHDMIIAGDGFSTSHFGASFWNKGGEGIDSDDTGLLTARNLGKRIAELAEVINN